MPELMRSIIARFCDFTDRHNYARRYAVRLPVTISLLDSKARIVGARQPPTMEGHAHDISKTGLSLVVPSIRLGDRHFMCEDQPLVVTLELPTGPLRMQAAPVRYKLLDEDQTESGYLIGARIVEMSEGDHARFINYLRQVARVRPWSIGPAARLSPSISSD